MTMSFPPTKLQRDGNQTFQLDWETCSRSLCTECLEKTVFFGLSTGTLKYIVK